jgi:hypothetical protein
LLEGLTHPRASFRLARGCLGPTAPHLLPDQSIKCSGTSRALESKANPHADPLTLPGNHIPTLFDQPALCGHPRRCAGRPVSFHDTVPPTPVPPPRRPLERGRRHPRKRYDHLLCTRRGRRCDVTLAGRVFPITSGPVRPSPPLCRHPRHCSVIPITVGTQVDGTSPHPPLCSPWSSVSLALESAYGWRPSKSSSATTLEATPGQAHDPPRRPPEERFVRTTVNSTTLCTMLPHVALRSAQHDYKPPPLGL